MFSKKVIYILLVIILLPYSILSNETIESDKQDNKKVINKLNIFLGGVIIAPQFNLKFFGMIPHEGNNVDKNSTEYQHATTSFWTYNMPMSLVINIIGAGATFNLSYFVKNDFSVGFSSDIAYQLSYYTILIQYGWLHTLTVNLLINNKFGSIEKKSNRLVLEYGIIGNIDWLSFFELLKMPYNDGNEIHDTWWNLGQGPGPTFYGLGPILSIGYERDFFTCLFYIAGIFGLQSFTGDGKPDLIDGRNINISIGFKYRFCWQLL